MHHDPLNQERAINLSILTVNQNLVSFQIEPQAPLLVVPAQTSSKTGTALIAALVHLTPF